MVPPEEKETAPQAEGPGPGPASPDPASPGSSVSGEASTGAGPSAANSPGGSSPALPTHEFHDDVYTDSGDGYETTESRAADTALTTSPPAGEPPGSGPQPPAPPSGGDGGGWREDDEEEGMVRMSFFDHLAELRTRLFYSIGGLALAFGLSLFYANGLWNIVSRPAVYALEQLKVNPPELTQIKPMETFNIIWIKLPLLSAVFLASPWLLYQLWAFIAPGLYRRERRWAAPFVISTAGLFITGGLFAYFVVFRFALVFLLGLGIGNHIRPFVSVEEYFDIFVDVMLGIGVVFELPVLIFFLSLIRVVTSGFLMRHIRYAILIIHIIAAIVTPTPDVFNMELFALPMCLLFFVGVGAAYMLELKRDQKKFPWGPVLRYLVGIVAVLAAAGYFLHIRYGYHFVRHLPWFVR